MRKNTSPGPAGTLLFTFENNLQFEPHRKTQHPVFITLIIGAVAS
jgi:hypothetical protein